MPLVSEITATSYLNTPPAKVQFQKSEVSHPTQNRRPRVYDITLHSTKRVAGTATDAVFDLGDLSAAWDILRTNVDAGKVHYELEVMAFALECSTATPGIIEIEADSGWPVKRYGFSSKVTGTSRLMGISQGAVNSSLVGKVRSTLTEIPGGRVGIRLAATNPTKQAALDADASVEWVLSLCLTPTDY